MTDGWDITGYDSLQMCGIRSGFENRLTMERVSLYADPELNCARMEEIRHEPEEGLTRKEAEF